MNVLTLSIKQKFFDQILSGEKKSEYREIRPNNASKYCKFNLKNEFIEVVKYDQIKFVTGQYKGERPFAIVEVLGAEVALFTDDNDKEIVYTENGIEYLAAEIEYALGKIIQKPIV